jgi:Protein of unknown function DUF262
MKPATHTLSDLFGTDVRYVVPLYQRSYVWKKETHWRPLWEDVEEIISRQADPATSPASHFLGAVVLDQEDTTPGEATTRLVIDGQQRLTTLQLLLVAGAEEAHKAGAEREARLLKRLVRNNEDLTSGDERFKVWPTNTNQAAFRAVMTADGGEVGFDHAACGHQRVPPGARPSRTASSCSPREHRRRLAMRGDHHADHPGCSGPELRSPLRRRSLPFRGASVRSGLAQPGTDCAKLTQGSRRTHAVACRSACPMPSAHASISRRRPLATQRPASATSPLLRSRPTSRPACATTRSRARRTLRAEQLRLDATSSTQSVDPQAPRYPGKPTGTSGKILTGTTRPLHGSSLIKFEPSPTLACPVPLRQTRTAAPDFARMHRELSSATVGNLKNCAQGPRDSVLITARTRHITTPDIGIGHLVTFLVSL